MLPLTEMLPMNPEKNYRTINFVQQSLDCPILLKQAYIIFHSNRSLIGVVLKCGLKWGNSVFSASKEKLKF